MPCHVPATSVSSRRRSALSMLSPPILTARLDLNKQGERAAHDLVRRFSSGRWPLWRVVGMRRCGQALLLAVEWQRGRRSFSLASVSLTETRVEWRELPTTQAARVALYAAGRSARQRV
jgi:hypothetical protein